MRNFFLGFLVALLLFASGVLRAAQATLEWDGKPGAVRYEVWRGLDRLAEVTAPCARIELPGDALSTLVVTAVFPGGIPLTSAPFVAEPIQAQTSTELGKWDTFTFYVEHKPRRFARFYFPVLNAPLREAASTLQE